MAKQKNDIIEKEVKSLLIEKKEDSKDKPKLLERNTQEKPKLVPKIHFYAWFDHQLRDGKLKPWQLLEIRTFFKEKGLDEIEDPEIYDKFLKIY